MAILVVGASGATGKLLVEQLLESGESVKIIVRSTSKIPENWNPNEKLAIIKRNIEEITIQEMREYIADCKAVASCLGHNMTRKGLFGEPRKLVTNTVKLICEAILSTHPNKPIKFVLMNTAGNSNRDKNELLSIGEKVVITLIRLLLPPHQDNEKAADFLRVSIGQGNPYIEWTAVRPDTLINEGNVSKYSLHISPTRSALFNPGKTSRINVGHFMARLILENDVWNNWNGQMPVIYNDTEIKNPQLPKTIPKR